MPTKKTIEEETVNPYLKRLADLGFSRAESLVYVYLLERGTKTGVAKIAIGTNIHRQQIYLTLPSLLEAGLLEEVVEGKISKYKARPPQHLERVIRRKMVVAEDLAKELQKISKIGNEQDFDVVIGEQAFKNYELQRSATLPYGSSQYIIGVQSDKYMYITEDIQEEYAKNLKERDIKTFYLGGEVAPEIYNSITYHFERRTFPYMNLQHMSIVISEGRFAFYGNLEPVSAYIIHSDKIAEDYKQFFMLLWGMAK